MSEETSEAAQTGATTTGGDDRGRRNRDKDTAGSGEPRFKGRRRRKVSYLTINKIYTVDYKDVNILRRFINDRGKMLPSRQTGNTAKQQRMIARAIRRAREMALLPFVVTEIAHDRPPRGRSRDYGQQQQPPRETAPPAPIEETAAEPETA